MIYNYFLAMPILESMGIIYTGKQNLHVYVLICMV